MGSDRGQLKLNTNLRGWTHRDGAWSSRSARPLGVNAFTLLEEVVEGVVEAKRCNLRQEKIEESAIEVDISLAQISLALNYGGTISRDPLPHTTVTTPSCAMCLICQHGCSCGSCHARSSVLCLVNDMDHLCYDLYRSFNPSYLVAHPSLLTTYTWPIYR